MNSGRFRRYALMVAAALGGPTSGCGDASAPDPQPYPVVWSWTEPGVRTVTLRYIVPIFAPDCDVDSVTVTGPGLASRLTLNCTEARGAAFATPDLDFSLGSPPLPLTYTFRATIGGVTSTQVAEVDCYQPLPTGTAPAQGDTVSSPVTMRWALGSGTEVEYTVSVYLGGTKVSGGAVMDQNSLALALAPGPYDWSVSAAPIGLADGTSARHCGASWDEGSFTVQ